MGCHELREGVGVAGPCSRQELHRRASILASPVLTVAIRPSTLSTPASLETGRRRPPGFAPSWCQPFETDSDPKGRANDIRGDRKQMTRRVSQLIAGWRTGLSRPVLILQAGNALNYFGYGLILPFEIIYLHQVRGFSTSTAGLVLAATMGTAAIATPPAGALLDRYSAKTLVVAGSLASALGYAGFAFVDQPWQAFACSIVSGAGIGAAGTAGRTLTIRLVTREQRAAAFALIRVAGNVGLGSGATIAGFIVASAQRLSSFQALYFFDAVTYVGFALIVLAFVPGPRAEPVTATAAGGTGYRAVARDRTFLTVIAANVVLLVVGHTFFS